MVVGFSVGSKVSFSVAMSETIALSQAYMMFFVSCRQAEKPT
jgi:hypothetical protein